MLYALARTVRSNIQNETAIVVGAQGARNQAVRGNCMARAMGMLSGKGVEGIPRTVVEALLRHLESSVLLRYGVPPTLAEILNIHCHFSVLRSL